MLVNLIDNNIDLVVFGETRNTTECNLP